MKTSDSDPSALADYHACLLRLWREGEGGPWRASLQAVDGSERIGFADLERLFAYLLRLTDSPPAITSDPPA